MSDKFRTWLQNSTDLEKVIVISILAGIILTTVLIIEKRDEGFSSLYISPESYTNYPQGNIISFIYGVKSFEKQKTSYNLEIFIDNQLADKKNFEVNPGDVLEENETLKIPEVKLPAKVNLVLKSQYHTYAVHYWLKNPQETPLPVKTTVIAPVSTPVMTQLPAITPAAGTTPAAGITPAGTPTSALVLLDTRKGFQPKDVSIHVGDSVWWINDDRDGRSLTVASQEGLFSALIKEEKRFEYKFNKTGTFNFYLKEFPSVKGVVNVK